MLCIYLSSFHFLNTSSLSELSFGYRAHTADKFLRSMKHLSVDLEFLPETDPVNISTFKKFISGHATSEESLLKQHSRPTQHIDILTV